MGVFCTNSTKASDTSVFLSLSEPSANILDTSKATFPFLLTVKIPYDDHVSDRTPILYLIFAEVVKSWMAIVPPNEVLAAYHIIPFQLRQVPLLSCAISVDNRRILLFQKTHRNVFTLD